MAAHDVPGEHDRRTATGDWADLARAESLSLSNRAKVASEQAAALRAVVRQARLERDVERAERAEQTRARELDRAARPRPHEPAAPALPVEGTHHLIGAALRAAFGVTGVALDEIWLEYAALGGDQTLAEIGGYLDGRHGLAELEVDIFTHVVNEHLIDTGMSPLGVSTD